MLTQSCAAQEVYASLLHYLLFFIILSSSLSSLLLSLPSPPLPFFPFFVHSLEISGLNILNCANLKSVCLFSMILVCQTFKKNIYLPFWETRIAYRRLLLIIFSFVIFDRKISLCVYYSVARRIEEDAFISCLYCLSACYRY